MEFTLDLIGFLDDHPPTENFAMSISDCMFNFQRYSLVCCKPMNKYQMLPLTVNTNRFQAILFSNRPLPLIVCNFFWHDTSSVWMSIREQFLISNAFAFENANSIEFQFKMNIFSEMVHDRQIASLLFLFYLNISNELNVLIKIFVRLWAVRDWRAELAHAMFSEMKLETSKTSEKKMIKFSRKHLLTLVDALLISSCNSNINSIHNFHWHLVFDVQIARCQL